MLYRWFKEQLWSTFPSRQSHSDSCIVPVKHLEFWIYWLLQHLPLDFHYKGDSSKRVFFFCFFSTGKYPENLDCHKLNTLQMWWIRLKLESWIIPLCECSIWLQSNKVTRISTVRPVVRWRASIILSGLTTGHRSEGKAMTFPHIGRFQMHSPWIRL